MSIAQRLAAQEPSNQLLRRNLAILKRLQQAQALLGQQEAWVADHGASIAALVSKEERDSGTQA